MQYKVIDADTHTIEPPGMWDRDIPSNFKDQIPRVAKDHRVISTGYNGTPRGVRNCNEGGCPRCNGGAETGTRLDECLCSHGEENAITQAAYHGVSVRGASIYTTFSPCLICTKMIINAGVTEVIYDTRLPMEEISSNLFREAGIKVRRFDRTV